MDARTIADGNEPLIISCSAKCFVNVYEFGWSFRSFGAISSTTSSLKSFTTFTSSLTSAGGG